jgi:hypothetical protein
MVQMASHPQTLRIGKSVQKQLDQTRVLSKAIIRAITFLEISRSEAARIIGFSEASLSRLISGTKTVDPKTKEGELCLLFIRLFRNLDTLLGGDEAKMKAWLRAKNAYLGQSPLEAIQTVGGLVHVVSYLDAMRGKI